MVFQALALRPGVLHAANLSEADERKASDVLAVFESRFAVLSSALDRGNLTRPQFAEKRDQLARVTRANLRSTLSRPGSNRLDKYVRELIARIRVNAIQSQET